ncbi:peptidase M4 family protein [Peribacillus cavernae]|uniref:Neutral metalloproteinase n=1 Tax=Peribacillus cavernae TaxID=1674310 RepID=A0A3S0TXE1_9BACI|nr:M4 family metallopeptidase [Peribacillus cavernae]MDQ0219867.1 Zn-dependent metalloprotease [Peribacillus cavernae]RUQ26644.1 peptidase M4 family protein [Peribacillus cavernae]
MVKKLVIPMVLTVSLFTGAALPATTSAIQPDEQITSLQNSSPKHQSGQNIFKKHVGNINASNADAITFIEQNKDKLNLENPGNNLKVNKKEKDQFGMTHTRLQQTKNGVPVEGSHLIVHYNEKGEVKTINGQYYNEIEESNLDTTPTIQADEALKKAKAAIDAPKVLDYPPTHELVVYPFEDQNHLAYKVNLNFLGTEPGNWFVFINAKTGEVIDQYNGLMHANEYKPIKGKGTGVLGASRDLHLSHKNEPGSGEGTQFFLYDISHDGLEGMSTYDFKNQWQASTISLPGVLFAKKNNTWNEDYDRAAVDAHYNSEKVYHYYKNQHDRNSLDNKGMEIISTVHYGENYNNAFWNGRQMTYGDGDGKFMHTLSAGLDVAAHEMTHGVTNFTSGLKYRNQSGALNEAFSDIFGALVDEDDWEVGEDIMAVEAVAGGRDALRSLSNPSKYPVNAQYTPYGNGSGKYPKHMNEFYHLPLNLDNGGVHINSSIINHAAYLAGIQIGKEKLGKIYYRALTHYLTPDSNFSDARKALLSSATDIYGENSPESQATEDGLNRVGITQ